MHSEFDHETNMIRDAVNCGCGSETEAVLCSFPSLLCETFHHTIKRGFFGHRFYKPVHIDIATRFYNVEADKITSRACHADAG